MEQDFDLQELYDDLTPNELSFIRGIASSGAAANMLYSSLGLNLKENYSLTSANVEHILKELWQKCTDN